MKGLIDFAKGGEAAINDMMAALNEETRGRIDKAVARGCAARLVLEVDAALQSSVTLELRDTKGTVHEIATYSFANGVATLN